MPGLRKSVKFTARYDLLPTDPLHCLKFRQIYSPVDHAPVMRAPARVKWQFLRVEGPLGLPISL